MLTVNEFAKISGIGQSRIRQLTHVEGFPALRNGNKILIHAKKAAEWLGERAGESNVRMTALGR